MKILYEGVDIYPDISVHRCYHDMYAEKQSDELLLKLNDTRELWDSWNPKKGDTIAIEDGAAKTGKMFVESVVPESGIITLRAYSIPQSAKDKRSKSWEKVKFLQLAQEIAEGAKKVKPDLHVVSFEEDEKEDMLDWLDAQIGEGDAVLFKGSNSMKLGETAARFISVEKTPTSSGGE